MCNCNEHKCCDECLNIKTPHKWAKEIKAWADGDTIQFRNSNEVVWTDVVGRNPAWTTYTEYRIKPEPKPDVVLYGNFPTMGEMTTMQMDDPLKT